MTLPTPDFLRPVRPRPPLAWALLAAAAAVLGTCALDAWTAWQARAELRETVALLQRPDRRPAGPPAAAVAALAPLRAVLDASWRERMVAVEERTPPGVAWLSVELAHTGELQLVGTAPDSATALLVADRLGAAGPWSAVVVARIEPTPDKRQRFELRGTPRESAR